MFIRGVIIALVAVWGGAYFIHIGPKWAMMPAILTALYAAVVGVAMAIYGGVNYMEQLNKKPRSDINSITHR